MSLSPGDPPVPRRPHVHRWEWRAQKLGWLLMGAVVAAALAGVFGNGPAGNAVGRSGPLEVSYSRFVRDDADSTLQVVVEPPHSDEEVVLDVPQQFLTDNAIRNIAPTPDRVVAAGDRWHYRFPVRGQATLLITIEVRPQSVGAHRSTVALAGHAVTITQFVYP
ncbi:hypothetical protein ACWEKJ_20545 [Amycolatopsis thermoflava]|uniref:hypothetical protein n=1 Tax=Amycolatopsis thermoflava TaxID=84480 RepID=UPI003EBFABFD